MRRNIKIIRESIIALFYVIIVATITLLYVDYENIELLKHPLNSLYSLSAAQDQADKD
jgi:hypothetical protein